MKVSSYAISPVTHRWAPSNPAPADSFRAGVTPDPGNELRSLALQGGFELSRSFPGREGYQIDFLGPELKLPTLEPSLAEKVAERLDDPGNSVLDYTHFSLVMNKERRLPIYTVVNIDGRSLVRPPR